jgi:hypothetical protein
MTVRSGSGLSVGDGDTDVEDVGEVAVGVVGLTPSEVSSPGRRRTNSSTKTTTEATGIANRAHGFIPRGYRSFLGKLCEVMERVRSGRLSGTGERRLGVWTSSSTS